MKREEHYCDICGKQITEQYAELVESTAEHFAFSVKRCLLHIADQIRKGKWK